MFISRTGDLVYMVAPGTSTSIIEGTPVLAIPNSVACMPDGTQVPSKYHSMSYYATSGMCNTVYIYSPASRTEPAWAYKCHFLSKLNYTFPGKEDYLCYGVIPYNKVL